ncbi:N-acetyl-1-D-myo-Inosityl-2-amino-2-deoxy-alpha-D-glucopyranoside deacetylase MshB [Gordonia araii NBRC 100433]|uniref:N-acetyl-1-D-myo-Inosityl-2-amino-2-deoxy-alpha-D-glucopyranoside deacetylase MshB n=1 Tax=Gordonia araii NBRC 100433 TaxID=1073574 RepID=G7H0L6_9ACTN|nr:PIG-L family deacetylase [Gordonia araii]NNG96846.1 GlcNAc-PI de-N-acetylase [Gordonia araii NBRC 100433]GAB09391.1 N-acetyl-1-D-myo-Inosityl-2-amino-2-deoxy-alpha-D-glucopyranoside deacetylase MshB [Gordonia araii NBRC 100433]
MTLPRILCVQAHPDDETIWTGGTLARHCAAGGQADVLTTTWAAGQPRHLELVDALRLLGLPREPIMLGYADGGVADSSAEPPLVAVPFDDSVAALTAHIRALRPDIVLTTDAFGIYGHPDHIHTHRMVLAAAEAAAEPHLYPGAGPAWQVSSLYLVTVSVSRAQRAWEQVMASRGDSGARDAAFAFGCPDERIDEVVDVRAFLDVKWRALQAHRTEFERSRTLRAIRALDDTTRTSLLGWECYLRRDLVGSGRDLVA